MVHKISLVKLHVSFHAVLSMLLKEAPVRKVSGIALSVACWSHGSSIPLNLGDRKLVYRFEKSCVVGLLLETIQRSHGDANVRVKFAKEPSEAFTLLYVITQLSFLRILVLFIPQVTILTGRRACAKFLIVPSPRNYSMSYKTAKRDLDRIAEQ